MGTIYYETAPMPQTDGTNIVVNGDGKLDLGTDVITKLSVQIQSKSISGDTVTFEDTKIGATDIYLASVYCSDLNRFIKSRSVSGNTLSVTYDDDITGTTCVLQLFRKE